MAKFKDTRGQEWTVAVNLLQIRRVREATGVELGRLLADEMRRLQELSDDPELFGRVLFALCAKEAKSREIDEAAFIEGIAGDELEGAFEAFIGAFADFCRPRQREALLALVGKTNEIEAALKEKALTGIAGIDPQTVVKLLTSRSSAGDSPASSESTPAG